MAQHDKVTVVFIAGQGTLTESIEVEVRGRTLETFSKTVDKVRYLVVVERTGKGGTATRKFMCRSDSILSIMDTRQAPPDKKKVPIATPAPDSETISVPSGFGLAGPINEA